MKVLITGGCGFLGSNIAAHFLKLGAEVVIVDAQFRLGADVNLTWLESKAERHQLKFYRLDTADHEPLLACFQKEAPIDYVCHLAGQVAMTTSIADPRRDLLTNTVGTFNVLEALRATSPNALLAFSSTNKVYGDLAHIALLEEEHRYTAPQFPVGFDETLPLDFASPYGCSKGAADQYVRDWHRNFGLKTVVFRHSSIYGGRQFATYDQGWIGWFCGCALKQDERARSGAASEAFTISGSGKQVRDVLHADDLVDLYDKAFTHADAISGEIFNIGGGIENSLSLLELFKLLQQIMNFDSPLAFQHIERRKSDQDFFVADIRRARSLMEWRPRVDKEVGISRMIEWQKQITER